MNYFRVVDMSDPTVSDIDFKNKTASVSTTLKISSFCISSSFQLSIQTRDGLKIGVGNIVIHLRWINVLTISLIHALLKFGRNHMTIEMTETIPPNFGLNLWPTKM